MTCGQHWLVEPLVSLLRCHETKCAVAVLVVVPLDETCRPLPRFGQIAMRQGSCRLNYAAKALFRACAAMSSLSGLSVTGPIGVQFLTPRVQRLGLAALAFRYSV